MKKFDVTESAAYVDRIVNTRYYANLLAAIEHEAFRYCYAFEESATGEIMVLPSELRDALARALLRAKIRIVAPGVSETDRNEEVERRMLDDEGRWWLDEILLALHSRGITLARRADHSVVTAGVDVDTTSLQNVSQETIDTVLANSNLSFTLKN